MKRLPCPFCGSSEQEIYDLYYDGLHVLVFCKCGAQAGSAEDEEEAIGALVSAGSNRPLEHSNTC